LSNGSQKISISTAAGVNSRFQAEAAIICGRFSFPAWHGRCSFDKKQRMKRPELEKQRFVSTWICRAICLAPCLLLAHPGHYHPDETDEFDSLKANFLHTHGALEGSLACVAVAAVFVAWLHKSRPVRLSALAMAIVAVAVIAIP
jgi:hypothetical protein